MEGLVGLVVGFVIVWTALSLGYQRPRRTRKVEVVHRLTNEQLMAIARMEADMIVSALGSKITADVERVVRGELAMGRGEWRCGNARVSVTLDPSDPPIPY